MSTPPNLLADIFRVVDPDTRQACKSLWDALNAARAQIGTLEQQIAALQAQDAATAAQLASVGVEGLSQVVGSLNQQMGVATSHPYLILTKTAAQTLADLTSTEITWNEERYISGGDFHSTSTNNSRVFIGKLPGIWLSVASVQWDGGAAGVRDLRFTPHVYWESTIVPDATSPMSQVLAGLLLAGTEPADFVNAAPFVAIEGLQSSGGNLDILTNTIWALYYLSPFATGQRAF